MKRLRPPSQYISSRVLAQVKKTSLRRASRDLDLAEVTVASLAAGLDCTPETERHAEARLDQLQASA
jgi:hypothetical protein